MRAKHVALLSRSQSGFASLPPHPARLRFFSWRAAFVVQRDWSSNPLQVAHPMCTLVANPSRSDALIPCCRSTTHRCLECECSSFAPQHQRDSLPPQVASGSPSSGAVFPRENAAELLDEIRRLRRRTVPATGCESRTALRHILIATVTEAREVADPDVWTTNSYMYFAWLGLVHQDRR